jgi:hypothetical protein
MKIYAPLLIGLRVVFYSILMFGIAEAIRFDALHPFGDVYFSEISFTEIGQEIFLFVLIVFYFWFGFKNRSVQPLTNLVALFFLISFIREFNNFIEWWFYPALAVIIVFIWLAVRDFKKIKNATVVFFSQPASGWFLAGFLITYIFSRLFGRKIFWKLLYSEDNYRLAKSATEEGIELAGYALMIIAATEFSIFYFAEKKKQ